MPQYLICYEDSGRSVIYTTAYTEDEVKRQIVKCVEKYGKDSRVRSFQAAEFPPSRGSF